MKSHFLVLSLVLLQVGITNTKINTLVNKIANLSSTNKIHLKTDVIDSSVVDDVRQRILYRFFLDKPSGYKLLCEPETIHYKK